VASGIVNASVQELKVYIRSKFIGTGETNSVLEFWLALYCPIFEEKSSCLTVPDFSSLRKATSLFFFYALILYFSQSRCKNKILGCTLQSECAWKDSNAFVVLNNDAYRTDWGQWNLNQYNVLKAVTKLFHSPVNSEDRI
jgi:hypothetical protein